MAKTRDALTRTIARADVLKLEVTRYPTTGILLYTQVDESNIDIRAHVFAPHHGIPEDPPPAVRMSR